MMSRQDYGGFPLTANSSEDRNIELNKDHNASFSPMDSLDLGIFPEIDST